MTFKRFVVVGVGRSGTRYASQLFTRMGVPCAHQKIFDETIDLRNRSPSWGSFTGGSSAFAAKVLDKLDPETLIIHQVRNPWYVARSLVAAGHLPEDGATEGHKHYGRNVEGLGNYDRKHLRAAHLWWQWNLLIEQIATQGNYLFHRVEDYTVERAEHILKLLGIEFTWKMREVLKSVKTNVGSVNPKHGIPNLQGMPHGFWGMVDRYGYERPNESFIRI